VIIDNLAHMLTDTKDLDIFALWLNRKNGQTHTFLPTIHSLTEIADKLDKLPS